MVFQNPVIRGYYPDPSVCKAKGKYYLAASSFQYFPGVPLFESGDLVNWKQIGFCLTRESQLPLDNVGSSGGVYAPTLRYNDGVFYMVTTNVGHKCGGNFYVKTCDIYGKTSDGNWSQPIFVDQSGIDPSLYFEDGKAYFMSNGSDDKGKNAILQCEIDIATGKKLTESRVIWHGAGGRYLEAPHLYKIGNYYYLMAAEGGTEYGHMVVYARSGNLWGPFELYSGNPVLTNRNLGGYQLQGIGHGDLIEDENGNWWMFTLGFRQIDKWMTYHHLGREVCLVPVVFKDGWFTAGDGTVPLSIKTDLICKNTEQQMQSLFTFENTQFEDWQFLRKFNKDYFIFEKNSIKIKSTEHTLDTNAGIPSFICLHQKEFNMELLCGVKTNGGEAGISVYMDENHHYDLALVKNSETYKVILKLNIGDIKYEKTAITVSGNEAQLKIVSDAMNYKFYCTVDGKETMLGAAQTRYLSSEVAGGFTGVVLGLYSQYGGSCFNEFTDFKCSYSC